MPKTTIAVLVLVLSGAFPCFGEIAGPDTGARADERALSLGNSIKEIKACILSVTALSRQTDKKVDLLAARVASDSARSEEAESDIVDKLNNLRESIAGLQNEMTSRLQEISHSADLSTAETETSNRRAIFFLVIASAGLMSGMVLLSIAMLLGFRKLSRSLKQMEKNKNLVVLPQTRPKEPHPAVDHTLACILARELFRMKTRAGQPGISGESIGRAIGRLEDELTSRGYAVRNLDGQPYRTGMAVQVVNFIVTPGVAAGQERVVRTIRPEITWKGTLVDPGAVEVAVGEEIKTNQPKPNKTEAVYVSQNH